MIEKTKVNDLITLISLRKKDKLLSKSAYLNEDLISKAYNINNIGLNDSVLVIDSVEVLPYLYRNGITDVTYIQYSKISDEKIPTTDMLGYSYINISNKRELGKLKMSKKFDVILSNPSYSSNTDKTFFNTAFEYLNDGGTMSVIQPSRPITFACDEPSDDDKTMRNIVENNESAIKLIAPTEVENFYLFYLLTCTTVKKNASEFKGVDEFTDLSGNVYNNVNVNDINFIDIDPDVYRSMVGKIEVLVNHYGSLSDVVFANKGEQVDDKKVLRISANRGNYGTDKGTGYKRSSTFFTWCPVINEDGVPVYKRSIGKDFGIIIDKDIDEKDAYTYFTSYFARFCMALGKNSHRVLGSKCIDTTPNMITNKAWTDAELFEAAGFTDEEITAVYNIIPKFYQ